MLGHWTCDTLVMGDNRDMDERPVHFELQRYGETPHGMLGFHLRFTRMRSDVTCRRCLRYIENERRERTSP